MESSISLIGSMNKPCLQYSLRGTTGLYTTTPPHSSCSGAQVLKCKRWKQQVAVQLMSTSQSRLARFVTLSKKGSDDHAVVHATSGVPFEYEPSNTLFQTLQGKFDAFSQFSRLYAFLGVAMGIVSASLIAVEKLSDFSPLFLTRMTEAIVAAFFMHIYSVGINQLADVEIDKVNKSYLPLASGEYSTKTATMITLSFAILGFWLGRIVGSWQLFCYVLVSFVIWTAYSINVPFLRWKKSAFLAALCFAASGLNAQFAIYFHIQTHVFGRPATLSKTLIFSTVLVSLYALLAAILKDIPDLAGDKLCGVRSFAVQLGPNKVFRVCIALLQTANLVSILVGLTSSQPWSKLITIVSHIFLSIILFVRAKSVDLESKEATQSFYMFFWKIFYVEYLLVPLVR
ncbi:OLC1v1033244C1 [Oldenlandia corymbosa var. corymbosa]|uniref:OLC1v1033244C1 n=1 Tax=Oldenlandia corymbosa var. corymbosa TaxID=529605 RepID=A0AAV1CQI7_OLDCO|nr:OLC1v1033244C1 [Oldenlandia corymbosa var. corymbosa]